MPGEKGKGSQPWPTSPVARGTVSWTLEFFLAIHADVGPEVLVLNKKKGLVSERAYGALILKTGTER